MSAPQLSRWRPLRAGIRNVWEYDDHLIDFADGRMILRGPNGSGKSNALALMFPFLIDGTMSAAAMDPFAGGRSMKSLLLGSLRDDDPTSGRFRHDQRLGYVWMEFERSGGSSADDVQRVTIGCGARASAQSDARSWFFVTDRRVGTDLDLAPGGEPLTRGRLAEELGQPSVFDTAEEYRAAVDRALYGLGAERLGKLVSLIRVLRRPQLAGKLDLDLLSSVLSQGLPAIEPAVLDDVAASLDDLEATQRELSDLLATRAVIDAFVPVYMAYFQGEAGRRTWSVLDADAQRRRAVREEKAARRDLVELDEAREANRLAREEIERSLNSLEERRTAVLESAAFRSASELRDVERAAVDAERRHVDASDRHEIALSQLATARQYADEQRNLAADAERQAAEDLRRVIDAADALDAAWTLAPDEAAQADLLRRGLRAMSTARHDDLRTVRQVLREVDLARSAHAQAEAQLAVALQAVDDADGVADDAAVQLESTRAALREAISTWVEDSVPPIDAAAVEELIDSVAALHEPGALTLVARYDQLTAPSRESLSALRRSHEEHGERLAVERVALDDERAAVAAAVDPGPAPPHWRDAARDGRAGAPLWACCDFAQSVDENDRAGLEAALDAAGLLDAWVEPAGKSDVEADADEDSFLVPVDGSPAVDRPLQRTATLTSVLVASPPPGSGLTGDEVARALGTVGLGDLGIAVSQDGRFVLGPLRGRARKEAAEFIGATARAERRRRRLAELDEQLQRLADLQGGVHAKIEQVDQAIAAIADAQHLLPPPDELLSAARAHVAAAATARAQRDVAEAAASVEALRGSEVATSTEQLHRTATQRRLPSGEEGLDRVETLLQQFDASGSTAVGARSTATDMAERSRHAEVASEEAAEREADRAAEVSAARTEAEGLQVRADTLRELVGADAEAPIRALNAAEADLGTAKAESVKLGEQRSELDQKYGDGGRRVEDAQGGVEQAARRLGSAVDGMRVLRRRDLLALLSDSAGADDTDESVPLDDVEFANWLAESLDGGSGALASPSPEHVARQQKSLDAAQKVLIDELHHGYDAAIVHEDAIVLIEVSSDAGVFPLARLAEELEQQQERLEEYLTEGDREVFERYLLNQISHLLRRLLSDADEFVAGVNDALGDARTASGLRVELNWALSVPDDSIARAVRLLRQDTQQMGDEDREALRRFFDRVIKEERANDPTAGYRVALERALDYRSWHSFTPVLISPTGTRMRLNRARFRELSGGEQAVALHLPLFAAAAAHYAQADPAAPRLIALDEAFAGIDEVMRGELMGLTVRFDLDVIMTGHELWGAYAEVPSIAIHDLLRRPPEEGVSILSLRWDGAGLVDS